MPYTSAVCSKQNVSVNYSKTMFHVEVAFYSYDILRKMVFVCAELFDGLDEFEGILKWELKRNAGNNEEAL